MRNYVKHNSTIKKTKSFNCDLSQNKTFCNKCNNITEKFYTLMLLILYKYQKLTFAVSTVATETVPAFTVV